VEYGLFQNRPNPVISSTKIAFNLQETVQVDVQIYNVKGQLVKFLYSGVSSSKILEWDGKDANGRELASGIYFYNLNVNGMTTQTKNYGS